MSGLCWRMIERALGTHMIMIPMTNHDDNRHGFNENRRIQHLWDGIEPMDGTPHDLGSAFGTLRTPGVW